MMKDWTGLSGLIRSHLLAPAAIVLAAMLAFGLTMKAGFMWDDHRMLEQNPRLAMTTANLAHAFASDPFYQGQNYYRPLQTVSNMVDFSVWGLRPFGYHLTNLFFHTASALLFFYLCITLGFGRGASLWAAVLLAAHPAAVEQLLIIAGRAELAAAACTLASVLLFLKERYVLSFMLFVAATGFKETGVIAPALTALCLWYLRRAKKDYLKLLPFLAFIPLYLLARHAAIGQGLLEKGLFPTLAGMILKVPRAIFVYLRVTVFPLDLHSHRMQPAAGPLSWLALAAGLALMFWLLRRRGGRNALFLAGWFLINLAPKMPILGANDLMLDHWVYLANAALFLGAAITARRLPWSRHARAGQAGAVLTLVAAGFLAACSAANALERSGDLKNYEFSARRSSSKPMLYNLAREYFLRGDTARCRAIMEQLALAAPGNKLYLNGLALARRATGNTDGAFEAIDEALAAAPGDPETLMNEFSLLMSVGRKAEAEALLNKLLADRPDYCPALLAAGREKVVSGRAAEADAFYTRLLAANPYDLEGLNDYGILLARSGNYAGAATLFRRALKISPGLESARANLTRLENLKR